MKLDASFTAFPIPREAPWSYKKETKEEIKKHERGWKKRTTCSGRERYDKSFRFILRARKGLSAKFSTQNVRTVKNGTVIIECIWI